MMVRQLPPELASIARDELNEDPKRVQEDLVNIKDWIRKQSHLKARTDDQWLLSILRGCKFSLERMKKKVDLYYTLRSTAPEITKRFKPTDQMFFDILKLGVCVILPKSKDVTAPRVFLIRPGVYDTEQYTIADIICVFYYLIQILVNEDDTATVAGTKILVDYNGITMAHLAQANPALLKKVIVVLQDSVPLRLKGNLHLNLPQSVEAIINLVKTLISEKAKQRLKVLKSYDELLSQFSKETIPVEYGGQAGTIAEITENWVKKCHEYKAWMEQEEQLGTDETRRVGRPQTAEEMFGIQGSFRRLDLD